jgi:hypothetical protein
MDEQQLKDFYETDPGSHITGPDHTGTVDQQINFAVLSYSWVSQLWYGYVADDDEVRKLIVEQLRARGVLES